MTERDKQLRDYAVEEFVDDLVRKRIHVASTPPLQLAARSAGAQRPDFNSHCSQSSFSRLTGCSRGGVDGSRISSGVDVSDAAGATTKFKIPPPRRINVIVVVCLSVCLSVSNIVQKLPNGAVKFSGKVGGWQWANK